MFIFVDFSEPLQLGGPKKKSDFVVSEDGVAMILSMGFSQEQAVRALKATVSIFTLRTIYDGRRPLLITLERPFSPNTVD